MISGSVVGSLRVLPGIDNRKRLDTQIASARTSTTAEATWPFGQLNSVENHGASVPTSLSHSWSATLARFVLTISVKACRQGRNMFIKRKTSSLSLGGSS